MLSSYFFSFYFSSRHVFLEQKQSTLLCLNMGSFHSKTGACFNCLLILSVLL
jgi:hypothetical protein